MEALRCDVAIVGAGVAGLTTALQLPSRVRAIVVCKTALGSGAATAWAQGGIAAAVGSDDAAALHGADTLRAAAGIADRRAVGILANEASESIDALRALGAAFDRDANGSLALGLEAGHSRRRIVRAGGDATGFEVLRALVAAVRARENVAVLEHLQADDVLLEDERAIGIAAHDVRTGERVAIGARATVLATGGSGRLFRFSTNPADATGDGVAIAARAGALLADMEFVQFHPTALAVDRDPLPLVTEAIRGEGAVLLDARGERFMPSMHVDAELAPRDVVARAIFARRRLGPVVLDARPIGHDFARRFPTVFASCMQAGIDPRVAPIPVTPAAHYAIGGVAVDERGRSSIPGLWACGETSATGIHGANRLASNSLLEALVFAARVAADVAGADAPLRNTPRIAGGPIASANDACAIDDLRALMYANVGVERNERDLATAVDRVAEWQACPKSRSTVLSNLLAVGYLVARAALDRRESRGCHYRTDYPTPDSALAARSFTRLETVA